MEQYKFGEVKLGGEYNNLNIPPFTFGSANNLTPDQMNDQAFYTAGAYSTSPLHDYFKIRAELEETGVSQHVEYAKDKFADEQNNVIKDQVKLLVESDQVSEDVKRRILQQYTTGDFEISDDLKRAFGNKLSTSQEGNYTQSDEDDTTKNIETLEENIIDQEVEQFVEEQQLTTDQLIEALIDDIPPERSDDGGARSQEEFDDNMDYALKNLVHKNINQTTETLKGMAGNAAFMQNMTLDFFNYMSQWIKSTIVGATDVGDKGDTFKNWKEARAFVEEEHKQSALGGILGAFSNLQKKVLSKLGFTEEDLYNTDIAKGFENLGEGLESLGEITADHYKSFGDPKADNPVARMAKPLKEGDSRLDPTFWATMYEGLLLFTPFLNLRKKGATIGLKESYSLTEQGVPVDPLKPNTFKVNDVEVSSAINTVKPKADTPLSISLISNPKQTVKMIETALEDTTGQAFKALRTNANEVINWFYTPSFLPKKVYANHAEIKPVIENLIGIQNRALHNMFLDPNDVNFSARHKTLHNIGLMIDTPDIFYPSSSLSELRPFYDKIGAKIVYRKDHYSDFNSRAHVTEVYNELNSYLDSLNLPKEHRGVLVIEDVLNPNAKPFKNPEALYKDAKYSQDGLSAKDKQFRINWYTESTFDPLGAMLEGLENVQYKFIGRNLTKVLDRIDTRFWNAFSYTGRFPKAFDRALVNTSLRGSALATNQLEFLSNLIKTTNFKFKGDLYKTLLDSEHKGRNYTRLTDITDLYPNKPLEYRKKLHEAVAIIEQINRFNHTLSNTLKKQQLNRDGFNRSVVIQEGIGTYDKQVPIKEVFVYDTRQSPIVWDVVEQRGVMFKPKNSQQRSIDARDRMNTQAKDGVFDRDGRQLVQLESMFTPAHGQHYRYALLGLKDTPKSLPKDVVPRRRGYMSQHLETNFVVRRYPRNVMVDGINYTAKTLQESKAQFGVRGSQANFAEVVGASPNKQTAKRYVEDFNRKDNEYFYEFEKVSEDVFSEYQNVERITNSVRNSAKERSTNEIVGATYEDVASTFFRETRGLSEQFAMSQMQDIIKSNWVDIFGSKLAQGTLQADATTKAGKFPTQRPNVSEIALSNNSSDLLIAQQAVASWDRITLSQMGVPDNIIAKGIRSLFDGLAAVSEPTAKLTNPLTRGLERVARKVSRNANFIESMPSRVISTTLITMNVPFKHIVLQPQAVLDTIFANGPATGLANMYNMSGFLNVYLRDSIYFSKYKDGFNFLIDDLYTKGRIAKNNKIDRKLIMSQDDLRLAAREMKESGTLNVDQHVMVQGITSADPIKIQEGFFGKTKALAMYPLEKLVNFNRKVGFNFGEQLNRIGMWMAAKSMWEVKNPGKNWRTRKALDEINYNAWELGGSMTKEGSYAYQRVPILKWFTQFMSYPQKAAELLVNPGAGPLTPMQRGLIGGWRMWFYGIRSGSVYGLGNMLYNHYKDINSEFAQNLADFLDTDAGVNFILNAMLNQAQGSDKVDLDFAATYSPLGGMGGTSFTQMYQILKRVIGGDINPYEDGSAPVLQQAQQLMQWWKTIVRYNEYHGGVLKPENMMTLFKRSARLTTGTNAISKAFKRYAVQDKLTRYGQEVGLNDEGKIEGLVSSLFGVQDKQEKALYESFSNGGYKRPNDLEQLAKELVGDYIAMTKEPTWLSFQQYKDDMEKLMIDGIYHQDEAIQILEYMDERFDRAEGGTMLESRIRQLQDLESLDPKSKRAIQNLVDSPEMQNLMEELYPNANFKFKRDTREDKQ